MAEEERKNEEAPKDRKSDTSRIELSEAEAPEAGDTSREPVSISQVLGRSGNKPPPTPDSGETAHIVLKDEGAGEGVREKADETSTVEPPSATARIQLKDQGAGEGAREKQDETSRVDDDSTTSRIKLEEKASEDEAERTGELGKDSTVRVDLTEVMARAGATSPSKPEADDRESTARIEAKDDAATTAPPPRTVRLKRPSDLPRPVSVGSDDKAPPKTVVLKKPGTDESKQSTSRIAVPDSAIESAPPSSRKTIRIKRSAAPSSPKTLTIARPSRSAAPTLPGDADETLRELEAEVRGEPGVAFSILAIAALLVFCVLVYVLAAQTIAPDLPFPGRLS